MTTKAKRPTPIEDDPFDALALETANLRELLAFLLAELHDCADDAGKLTRLSPYAFFNTMGVLVEQAQERVQRVDDLNLQAIELNRREVAAARGGA